MLRASKVRSGDLSDSARRPEAVWLQPIPKGPYAIRNVRSVFLNSLSFDIGDCYKSLYRLAIYWKMVSILRGRCIAHGPVRPDLSDFERFWSDFGAILREILTI